MNKETEEVLIEGEEIDELIRELEAEAKDESSNCCEVKENKIVQVSKSEGCTSVWRNFWKSWNRVPKKDMMRYRFQKLAGIINNKTIASLTLPNGTRITFDELPHWWDVVRYKICGFKYETYYD